MAEAQRAAMDGGLGQNEESRKGASHPTAKKLSEGLSGETDINRAGTPRDGAAEAIEQADGGQKLRSGANGPQPAGNGNSSKSPGTKDRQPSSGPSVKAGNPWGKLTPIVESEPNDSAEREQAAEQLAKAKEEQERARMKASQQLFKDKMAKAVAGLAEGKNLHEVLPVNREDPAGLREGQYPQEPVQKVLSQVRSRLSDPAKARLRNTITAEKIEAVRATATPQCGEPGLHLRGRMSAGEDMLRYRVFGLHKEYNDQSKYGGKDLIARIQQKLNSRGIIGEVVMSRHRNVGEQAYFDLVAEDSSPLREFIDGTRQVWFGEGHTTSRLWVGYVVDFTPRHTAHLTSQNGELQSMLDTLNQIDPVKYSVGNLMHLLHNCLIKADVACDRPCPRQTERVSQPGQKGKQIRPVDPLGQRALYEFSSEEPETLKAAAYVAHHHGIPIYEGLTPDDSVFCVMVGLKFSAAEEKTEYVTSLQRETKKKEMVVRFDNNQPPEDIKMHAQKVFGAAAVYAGYLGDKLLRKIVADFPELEGKLLEVRPLKDVNQNCWNPKPANCKTIILVFSDDGERVAEKLMQMVNIRDPNAVTIGTTFEVSPEQLANARYDFFHIPGAAPSGINMAWDDPADDEALVSAGKNGAVGPRKGGSSVAKLPDLKTPNDPAVQLLTEQMSEMRMEMQRVRSYIQHLAQTGDARTAAQLMTQDQHVVDAPHALDRDRFTEVDGERATLELDQEPLNVNLNKPQLLELNFPIADRQSSNVKERKQKVSTLLASKAKCYIPARIFDKEEVKVLSGHLRAPEGVQDLRHLIDCTEFWKNPEEVFEAVRQLLAEGICRQSVVKGHGLVIEKIQKVTVPSDGPARADKGKEQKTSKQKKSAADSRTPVGSPAVVKPPLDPSTLRGARPRTQTRVPAGQQTLKEVVARVPRVECPPSPTSGKRAESGAESPRTAKRAANEENLAASHRSRMEVDGPTGES